MTREQRYSLLYFIMWALISNRDVQNKEHWYWLLLDGAALLYSGWKFTMETPDEKSF